MREKIVYITGKVGPSGKVVINEKTQIRYVNADALAVGEDRLSVDLSFTL